ncbi:MAG: DUF86 domain-containing protein [Pseudomonadota bacterium]
MLDAAREAVSFTAGKSRDVFNQDRMLVLSIVKCIEIVGEAAGTVSEETRSAHPDIPWTDIIAMRNRLIHAYFNVNLDIVWNTVNSDLPELIAEIEKIL